MKNPIIFFIFVFFTIVNIIDIITALFILPGEANPLYLFTNSIAIVIVAKVIVIFLIWKMYRKSKFPSNIYYYLLVLLLIVGTFMVGFAVLANVNGIRNPELLELAKTIPDKEKMDMYFDFIKWFYFLPMIFCIISFYIYDKTRHHVEIDKEYFKKKPWWRQW